MEATPGYFYGGSRLARGLDEMCPGVRVLVSLRSPVERCWSWYRFNRARLRLPEDLSFDAYLDRCEELHRAGVDGNLQHQPFWGLGGGCYDTWFDAWVQELGPRFHVVFFEELARDPAAVVGDVCRWLEVDDIAVDGFEFAVANRAVHYRAAPLQRVAVAVNRRGETFFLRHRAVKSWIRSACFTINRRSMSERIPPSARARLGEFYRPHNDRLADQLASAGVRPPPWLSNRA